MTEQHGSWCSRCRASVPLSEWRFLPAVLAENIGSWKHVGPMRDGPDFLCSPDEDGNTGCGWTQKIPKKIGGGQHRA